MNGVGGGNSSLSKIIIVRPSADPDIDVDYLHGQVSIHSPLVDYSANCGNLSGAVAPFAINEGLVAGRDGTTTLRLRNLNTGDVIVAKVPTPGGTYPNSGNFRLAGVSGTGCKIELDYLAPSGGVILPTGSARDMIDGIEVTLALAPLPTVWIDARALGADACAMPEAIDADAVLMARLERIRRLAAVRMGLSRSVETVNAASPKIGLVGAPTAFTTLNGATIAPEEHDLCVRVLSSGVILARPVVTTSEDGASYLSSVAVETSARWLMAGHVYFEDPARAG